MLPFKDHNLQPDSFYGWSPERSVAFGQDMLTAILAVTNDI
ncbi:carboxypeptidase family protein [Photobacterium chitinilyticum]|nr:carboxypeptidase family protein [Photobacterium chitinilyticum]